MISVLYVDDEKDLLKLGKIFLEKFGNLQVDLADSVQKAMEILSEQRYDAIISDYQMPGKDGIEFLKEVRLLYGQIPFILFTGKGREEVVILALNSGADFYLQKGGDPVSQFTELKNQVEKAVREHQAVMEVENTKRRLEDIINFLPDATFAINADGEVIAWNKAIEEMTGVPSEEMLGKGEYEYALPFYGERRPILIDLIFAPPEDIRSRYFQITQDGTVLTAKTALPRPKGTQRILWGKASPLNNPAGEIVGAIESIRDITEQETTLEMLKQSEERYRTLAESSHDFIYIIDKNDRIVYVNSCAADKLELPKTEIIGRPRADFFQESSNKSQQENIQKVFRTGTPLQVETQVSFLHYDIWQNTYLIPLKDNDGEVIEVMGVTRDLSGIRPGKEL
jgi:PAS domain S-box-containing protein